MQQKQIKMISSGFNKKILIVVFTDDIYKFHYALSMSASLKAIEKEVSVFITGYACNYISQEWEKNGTNNVNKKFKEKKMATLNENFSYCSDLNVNFFYCTTALNFLNIKKIDLIKSIKIKPIGMYSIFNNHKESQIIFI